MQLLLAYKNYRGKISFQSLTGANVQSNNRVPFGQVAKCEFYSSKNSISEISEYFIFTNLEGQKIEFNLNFLNFLTAGVSPVNQIFQGLKTDGKFLLISHYISLLVRSNGFGLHRPDLHSELGFRIDGTGITEQTLRTAEGSLEEYKSILQVALTSANNPPTRRRTQAEASENSQVANVPSEIIDDAVPVHKKSKKITDFFGQVEKGKPSKAEMVEQDFEEEISDPFGVEQTFAKGLFGVAEIDLDKLSVSPKLGMVTNRLKVENLKRSMESRFDPTACVLMICPQDYEKFDSENLGNNRYYVVHGCHRLKALKLIDSEGGNIKLFRDVLKSPFYSGLGTLAGLDGRKIPCYIVKTDCSIIQNYGFIRGNDLQSAFSSKPKIHELVYIAEGLIQDGVSELEITNVSEKFAKTLLFRKEEITALKKVLSWKPTERLSLIMVLKKFESYCTLDASNRGNHGRLARGEKMPLTKTLFIQLGKVDGKAFAEQCQPVMEGELSLKDLLGDLSKASGLDANKALVSQTANYKSLVDLKMSYPGKFDDDILESFHGASSSSGFKNLPGIMLENYVKTVVSDKMSEGSVRSEIIDSIIQVDQEVIDKSDLIVCNIKTVPSPIAESLMASACSTLKDVTAVILLLPDRKAQMWAITEVDKNLCGKPGMIRVEQIFFDKIKSTVGKDQILENVSFGLLFGKFSVSNPPLKIFHGDLKTSLCKVVSDLLVPGSQVSYLNEETCPFIDIHFMKNLKLCKFVYYGEKKAVESLRNRWKKEKLVLDAEDAIVDGGDEREVSTEDDLNSQGCESAGMSNDDSGLFDCGNEGAIDKGPGVVVGEGDGES